MKQSTQTSKNVYRAVYRHKASGMVHMDFIIAIHKKAAENYAESAADFCGAELESFKQVPAHQAKGDSGASIVELSRFQEANIE